MPTASFFTLGCRLNQTETAIMAKGLADKGYKIIEDQNTADLCIINTCTVTNQSNSKCRKKIRSIQRKNPSAKIAVVGCFSQIASQQIADIGGVHLVLGNNEKLKIHEYLGELSDNTDPIIKVSKLSKEPFTIESLGQHLTTTRANLKIQDGCDFICSFCVIPSARGRSRARQPENIRDELKLLENSGVKEIVLTGVNIGTYLYEQTCFIDLLPIFEEYPGIKRIRISSIEPTTIGTEIFDWMANDSKLLPYLHLPLQTASDEILKKMRRRYTFEEYLDYIIQAKKQVPDICIGSDVIVGFPGETDEIFGETFTALKNAPIDYFHVFPYAERAGTSSEKLLPKVTPTDIQRRTNVLRKLSEEKREAFSRKFTNRAMQVLFETEETSGVWQGYSENYIRISVKSNNPLKNELRTVVIEDVKDGQTFGSIK